MHDLICFLKHSHGFKILEIVVFHYVWLFNIFKLWKLPKGFFFPLIKIELPCFYNLTKSKKWLLNLLTVHYAYVILFFVPSLKISRKKCRCINMKHKPHDGDFQRARWSVILLLCRFARGKNEPTNIYCCYFHLAAREIHSDSFKHVLSIMQ